MRSIHPTEIVNNEAYLILDIREPYELEICTISALTIPMAEVADRINEIPADKHIVVMCKSGQRAAAVANMLATEFNLPQVSVMEGGILGWIEEVDNSLEAY